MTALIQKVRFWIFQPVLGGLLSMRLFCRFAVCAGVFHIMLSAYGWHVWPCPLIKTFGIPCPGCGMTRSIRALISGDVPLAMNYHAFAPVGALALVILGVSAVLPTGWHKRFVDVVTFTERKTGVSQIALILLGLYWVARLLVADAALFAMLRGHS